MNPNTKALPIHPFPPPGQFSSCGCVGVWSMVPGLAGVGLGHLFISLGVMSTYTVLIVYSLHYLYSSLSPTLPWTVPQDDPACVTKTNSSAEQYFYCQVRSILVPCCKFNTHQKTWLP